MTTNILIAWITGIVVFQWILLVMWYYTKKEPLKGGWTQQAQKMITTKETKEAMVKEWKDELKKVKDDLIEEKDDIQNN